MANEKQDVDELLKTQEEVATLTRGISMRPLLREHQDMVVIKRPVFPLKRGAVPLYRVEGRKELTLHRILRVQKDGYVIRGDNLYFKEFVRQEQIVGVMQAFYRNGKHVNCETSFPYKLYVFWILHSYPLRAFWKKTLRPILGKIRRAIVPKK